MVACVIAAVALQGVSGLLLSAAGFSTDIHFDLASGARSVAYFHWGSVADLFGYLLMAPLVVYLYHRFRDDPRMVLYTAAGFAAGFRRGIWLLGAGLNFWRGGHRALATLPLAFAAIFLALAVYRLITF